MKENFEKYVAVTKLLGEFKLNLRKQILANIREILEQLPNNEINIDTETYNIWTDKDDFITKVYLNEVDKRLIVDTESDVGRDWYCADELDILEAITDILTKD